MTKPERLYRGDGKRSYVLPDSLSEVVEAIGVSATVSLVHVYAGTKIYLPKADNVTEHHPVARLLGLPLTIKLCQALGGEKISIPMCDAMLSERREEEIVRRWRLGESINKLAISYSISERSVFRILRRSR